jgi:hypothetical protein
VEGRCGTVYGTAVTWPEDSGGGCPGREEDDTPRWARLGRKAANGPARPAAGGKGKGKRVGPERRMGCRNLNQRNFIFSLLSVDVG